MNSILSAIGAIIIVWFTHIATKRLEHKHQYVMSIAPSMLEASKAIIENWIRSRDVICKGLNIELPQKQRMINDILSRSSDVSDENPIFTAIEILENTKAEHFKDLDTCYIAGIRHLAIFTLYCSDDQLTQDILEFNERLHHPNPSWVNMSYEEASVLLDDELLPKGLKLITRIREATKKELKVPLNAVF
jgi:hypothetical protein